MKKIIIVAFLILLASCTAVRKTASPEKESQDHLMLATLWYQRSAEMRALYYQCFRNASIALSENLAWSDKTKPAAVVLDIDETVLDNSLYQGWQILEGVPYNEYDWDRWVNQARAQALPGAAEFTRYADSLGVRIFYVSNRTADEIGPTLINLADQGLAGADISNFLFREGSSSKVTRREKIAHDYEILLLIGDNLADFSETYEQRGDDFGFSAVEADMSLFGTRYIMLPNPMYGGWLSEIMKRSHGRTTREKLVNMIQGF